MKELGTATGVLGPGDDDDADGVAGLLAGLQRELFGYQTEEPARVGRYILLSRIGTGGVGVVYAAYDPELDRRVAIKLLSRGRSEDRRWRSRLAREAQAMARIDHPNVVRVYDVGTFGGGARKSSGVFIVMELVEGATMAEWIEQRRSWAATLDMFVQAGRGLAAAHERGLIHRDFKPGNAIIGRDGDRVRVLDFGLARASQAPSTEDLAIAEPTPTGDESGTAFSTSLTRTGSVMGTPPYMAPEQHRGRAVDHRTDQYAFCVALFQALYRRYPFEGDSPVELAIAKGRGRPVEVARRGVPSRVHAAVLKGLSARPRDRFGSLPELVRELEAAVRRPRRWRRAALGLAGGVGVLAAGGAYAQRGEPVCAGASAIEAVWGDAQRQGLADAFGATELSFAPASAERVTDALDVYADSISGAYAHACAAPERGEQLWCLDRRTAEMRALVDVFLAPDRKTVGNALSATRQLEDPQRCRDQAYAAALLDGVAGDEARDELAAFKAEVAAARKSFDAGRYDEALRRADAVVHVAESLGQRRLVAEARYIRALPLQNTAVDERGAAEELEAAALELRATRQPELEHRAWTQLANLLADRLSDVDGAKRALRHAEAASEANGAGTQALIALWSARGTVHSAAGDYAEAEAAHREALALAELLEVDAARVASTLNSLANVVRRQGRFAEAVQIQQRALSLAEADLGEDHPDLGVYHASLAAAYKAMDLPAVALPHLQRAVVLFTEASGAGSPQVLAGQNNLAGIHHALKNYAEAEALWREVLDGIGEHGRPETRGNVLNNLGVAALDTGRFEEALGWSREAVEVKVSAFGTRHPALVTTYSNVGRALMGLGRPDEARLYFDLGAGLAATTLGADHPRTRDCEEGSAAAAKQLAQR